MPESTINKRLEQYFHSLKKNVPDMAGLLNTNPTTLRKLLKGENLPSSKILIPLSETGLSIDWLLTGEGEMLRNNKENKAVAIHKSSNENLKPIPLVNAEAVAGFGAESFTIEEQDVEDYYVIPEFRNTPVDFMIRVRGDSMMPRYCNGDIVACAIIRESKFLQWNAIHIIGTKEQGILMKRIKRGQDLKGLRLVSENPDFDAFEVQKSEITGIAIVKGGIKIE
jgi:phage repressor protein C with HTH and peptisase S24 domain